MESPVESPLELLKDQELASATVEIKIPIICLTMIVKNESKIITRCLDSAKDFVDYVCITDTGSTDDTPTIIETWCQEHKMPYKVFHDTFKGFGPSRTQSYENTKATFPETDYCLLLDADMVLEVPDLDKASLIKPSYRVNQYGSNLVYPNTRFIDLKHDWKLVCRTHEFWESKGLAHQGTLDYDQLRIHDLNDGG